jgi:hypothetical protein
MSASANNDLETQLDGVLKNILQICNRTYMNYDENTLNSSQDEIDVDVGNNEVVPCEIVTKFSHDYNPRFQKWNCTFQFKTTESYCSNDESAVQAMDDVLLKYIWGDSKHPSKLHADLHNILLHAFQTNFETLSEIVHQAVFFMKDYCIFYTYGHRNIGNYNTKHILPLVTLNMCHIEFEHPQFIESLKSVVFSKSPKQWNVEKGTLNSTVLQMHNFLLSQTQGQRANPRDKTKHIVPYLDDVIIDMILQNLKVATITTDQLMHIAEKYLSSKSENSLTEKSNNRVQLRLKLW